MAEGELEGRMQLTVDHSADDYTLTPLSRLA